MKTLRSLAAVLLTASVLTVTAIASDLTVTAIASDLTGTWKWTAPGRNGPMESTARLVFKDGVLSGTISGRMGDAPISAASLKDGKITFTVTREFNGNTFVITYDGQFEGDTITGTIERPGRDGSAPTKVDWKATRVVDAPAPAKLRDA